MADNHLGSRVHMAKLNEHCQRTAALLEYKDIDSSGPPHDPVFTVAVVINGKEYSRGTGKSKKDARGCAAKLALERIQQEEQAASPSRQDQEPLPSASSPPQPQPLPLPELPANLLEASPSQLTDYISVLNLYSSKYRLHVNYDFVDRDGVPHNLTFSCVCRIEDKTFPVGTGNNKKAAKSEAARLAYEELANQANSMRENAAPINSSENSAFTEPQDASKETSLESVPDNSDSASNTADSIVFETSGIHSNWDSEHKDSVDKLVDNLSAVELHGASSSYLVSSKSPAVKLKRKEMPLAPTFSKLAQKKSECTVDERFRRDFKLIERIGSGGFGTVFKAKHSVDGTFYAIKRVRFSYDDMKSKYMREVNALAAFRHDNIVRYYDCWIGKDAVSAEDSMNDNGLRQDVRCDCLFIRMEYCEKGTLDKWIQTENRKESYKDDAKLKFRQIVEGVEYIHSKKNLHRDLKPKNILIAADDKIKIGDFGLVTSGADDPSMERTQNTGTHLYMAPEQMASRKYGKEVDIFSLGLILFEMLYVFNTSHEKNKVLMCVREDKFPPEFCKMHSSEIPLIRKLLCKDPSKRPSATDVLNKLKNQLCSPHTI